MIRKTLELTKKATYAVELPNPATRGMPSPTGTGFFISADGWFVTAAHVVTENGQPDGPIRTDFENCWLTKECPPGHFSLGMCQFVSLSHVDASTDFALLKVDFPQNSNKAHLQGLDGFPFIRVSSRVLEDGEPVYSFGYPLSSGVMLVDNPSFKVGHSSITPRTTSAVVASSMDTSNFVSSPSDAQVYVLDKALNYGNSGGPIISAETGHVHALCSRFQPVFIPQQHLTPPVPIMIPSLYGIVSRLNNPSILAALREREVEISIVIPIKNVTLLIRRGIFLRSSSAV